MPVRFDAHLPAQLKVRGICAARQATRCEANKRKSCVEEVSGVRGGSAAGSAASAESGELVEPMELTEPGETAQLRAEVNSF